MDENKRNEETLEEKEVIVVPKVEETTPVLDSKKEQEPEENKEENKEEEVALEMIDKPIFHQIDERRKKFVERYRKFKLTRNLVLFIALALITGGMIGFSFIPNFGIWIGIGLVFLVLVAVWLLNKFLIVKKAEVDTHEYVVQTVKDFNTYSFDEKYYQELNIHEDMEISLEEFQAANIYKDLSNVSSRNVVTGKVFDHDFHSASLAGYVTREDEKGRKKSVPIFVGKYLSVNVDLKMDDLLLIYIKGKSNLVELPSFAKDMNVLSDNNTYTIYGKQEDKRAILNNRALSVLKKFKVNKYFLDLSISMQKNAIVFAIDYDDEVMNIPLFNNFTGHTLETMKEVGDLIGEFLKEILAE